MSLSHKRSSIFFSDFLSTLLYYFDWLTTLGRFLYPLIFFSCWKADRYPTMNKNFSRLRKNERTEDPWKIFFLDEIRSLILKLRIFRMNKSKKQRNLGCSERNSNYKSYSRLKSMKMIKDLIEIVTWLWLQIDSVRNILYTWNRNKTRLAWHFLLVSHQNVSSRCSLTQRCFTNLYCLIISNYQSSSKVCQKSSNSNFFCILISDRLKKPFI